MISPLLVGASMEALNGDPSWGFWSISMAALPLCLWLLKFPSTKPQTTEATQAVTYSVKELV